MQHCIQPPEQSDYFRWFECPLSVQDLGFGVSLCRFLSTVPAGECPSPKYWCCRMAVHRVNCASWVTLPICLTD